MPELTPLEKKLLGLKVGLLLVAALLLFGLQYAHADGVPDFVPVTLPPLTDNVMGPLFAILTATFLFITLVPHRVDNRVDTGQVASWMLEAMVGYCAYMAGWYWLRDATDGNPWPYLAVVILMAGMSAAVFLPYTVAMIIGGWTARRHRDAQEPDRS